MNLIINDLSNNIITDKEEKKTYSFDSINDLNMFMKGVDEANGWLEYEAINQVSKIEKVA